MCFFFVRDDQKFKRTDQLFPKIIFVNLILQCKFHSDNGINSDQGRHGQGHP